jgi:hypothetical protein
MTRIAALLLAGLLAGCVNQLAVRQNYLAQFVGRPESDLVLAMGVPNRTYETGGIKYLAYDDRRMEIIPATPMYGPPYWGWGGGGFPPQVINLVCETTIAVRDGVVVSFALRGNSCG